MRPPVFSYEETTEPDGTVRIALTGELDMAAAPSLERILSGLADANVVLDISDLEYLDSSGLAVLVAAHSRAADAGRSVSFTAPPPPIRRVFSVTGLSDLFRFR